MTTTEHENLVERGRALVQAYADDEAGRTVTLRSLAECLVELRARFETEDGMTDWTGRSGPYREAVAAIYAESPLVEEDLRTFQAALRYHVGNVVRDVAPADELDALGLRKKGPVDRSRETRERLAALARAGAAAVGEEAPDPLRLVTAAEVLLDRVASEDLEGLGASNRKKAVTTLRRIESRAVALLEDVES